jgi:predicted amidohydrolase
MFEEKINSITDKTELIILPETFSTGFSMKPKELAETMNDETIKWMKRIAAEKKVILTGSVIIKENETGLYGCCPMAKRVFMIKDIYLVMPEKTMSLLPAQKD